MTISHAQSTSHTFFRSHLFSCRKQIIQRLHYFLMKKWATEWNTHVYVQTWKATVSVLYLVWEKRKEFPVDLFLVHPNLYDSKSKRKLLWLKHISDLHVCSLSTRALSLWTQFCPKPAHAFALTPTVSLHSHFFCWRTPSQHPPLVGMTLKLQDPVQFLPHTGNLKWIISLYYPLPFNLRVRRGKTKQSTL